MPSRQSEPIASATPVSVASSSRDQWAWLDALGRSLNAGFLLVDPQGAAGPAIGAARIAEALRGLVERPDAPLLAPLKKVLESDRLHRDALGDLDIVWRRLTVHGEAVGALIVAAQARSRASR